MPFLTLPESGVKLWWRSNLPNDDLSILKTSSKPLIVLLQPLFLSIDFLDSQFNDPLLSNSYNMIAYDGVAYGRSECETYISAGYASTHDTWADTGLLALFAQSLQLPPFHIFAVQNNSVNTALRFSILFPTKCLSLTLCAIAGPTDLDWVSIAYSEIMQAWVGATDLEAFEEAIGGLVFFMFNERRITDDELDDAVEHWQLHYNPKRCTRILGVGTVVMTRVPLTPHEFAQVQVPVLILQGDSSDVHTVDFAYNLQKDLISVPGGASLEIIPNGPECLTVPLRFAKVVNKHFAAFLYSLPCVSSSTCSSNPERSIAATDMREALSHLSELAKNPDMAQLDPQSMWSFSRCPLAAQQIIKSIIEPWQAVERTGLSHLGPDGNPPRRFSERHHSTFFSATRTSTPSTSRPGSSSGRLPIPTFKLTGHTVTTVTD